MVRDLPSRLPWPGIELSSGRSNLECEIWANLPSTLSRQQVDFTLLTWGKFQRKAQGTFYLSLVWDNWPKQHNHSLSFLNLVFQLNIYFLFIIKEILQTIINHFWESQDKNFKHLNI